MRVSLDNTPPAAPTANRRIGRLLLYLTLSVMLVVTVFSLLGAHLLHIISGLILLLVSGLHLFIQRRWIKQVILSTPANPVSSLRRQRSIFWGLCISGLICGLSGVISIPMCLMPHVFLPLHCLLAPVHTISGFIFIALNIGHHIRHKNWWRAVKENFMKKN